ncbi:Arginine N-methyltransferase 2 [Taphrina deformans PYCC 5710]|uniref:Arginine N-methyltransferase 2 n=1 Tax=Taphrina deformans (strain PYCC 5710 / ATCC 11124 / CBS 356.35 / IMI 108563 / JCM 9778 / NBRC 8474) TaxID=1097556 RepID=R4X9J8_TAPDE|nr:Arginine N-methyltransferase 2 [Taphrina deformans PYCC 5710]|eukprot:CCG82436.1 Arginine N-methyltransferase 2 [Taphrina deformans PYCC 5710]
MDIEPIEITEEQLQLNRKFLTACTELDLQAVQAHIDTGCDVWFQDPESGEGALHITVVAAHSRSEEERGIEILNHLLSNGGVWNQMSKINETPGCTARRLFGHSSKIYQTLLNAGVRAELLLTALDKQSGSHDPSERNKTFLNGKLVYTAPTEDSTTLLDEENNAVMMTWEQDIMVKSAAIVVPTIGGGSVLNVGFGLGLIDSAIQARKPKRHVIIEAHPDVLKEMRDKGWYEKEGVEILEGRWQDVVDDLADRETFDGIYYDPFEYWEDMHQFFDSVVALLNPDGVFSFFHGLGADNQTFYDVYTRILEIELSDFGLDTTFQELDIETKDEEWLGAKRRYWSLDKYRLPTCKFMQ